MTNNRLKSTANAIACLRQMENNRLKSTVNAMATPAGGDRAFSREANCQPYNALRETRHAAD